MPRLIDERKTNINSKVMTIFLNVLLILTNQGEYQKIRQINMSHRFKRIKCECMITDQKDTFPPNFFVKRPLQRACDCTTL